MSAVAAAFNGPFKHQEHSGAAWERKRVANHNRQHCGSPVNNEPHQLTENQRYQLMDDSVQSTSLLPLHTAILERWRSVFCSFSLENSGLRDRKKNDIIRLFCNYCERPLQPKIAAKSFSSIFISTNHSSGFNETIYLEIILLPFFKNDKLSNDLNMEFLRSYSQLLPE